MKHKDYYNDQYILEFSEKIFSIMPNFRKKEFINDLIGKLEDKELFARFDLIVDAMVKYMEKEYSKNILAFYNLLGPELKESEGIINFGWRLWPISRYIERLGINHWELSLSFIKEFTKRFTGEYAIRPLLKAHPKEVLKELILWTKDENVHVRRLASEGVRIRLPWSKKLFVAIEEFDLYTILLTNLRNDSEKFVQRSVGNNLNDLFKESLEKAAFIIEKWEESGTSKSQEWIIKHGMRKQKIKI